MAETRLEKFVRLIGEGDPEDVPTPIIRAILTRTEEQLRLLEGVIRDWDGSLPLEVRQKLLEDVIVERNQLEQMARLGLENMGVRE
jgi:hypothetical protein